MSGGHSDGGGMVVQVSYGYGQAGPTVVVGGTAVDGRTIAESARFSILPPS